jgi:hypothetical protein
MLWDSAPSLSHCATRREFPVPLKNNALNVENAMLFPKQGGIVHRIALLWREAIGPFCGSDGVFPKRDFFDAKKRKPVVLFHRLHS